MKNFYFFESQSLVIDTISSNEWITTMTQLMKLAGNNLYEHSIDVALLTATMALTSNQELLSDISISSLVLGAFLHDIGYIGIPCIPDRSLREQDYSPIEKMAFDIHITAGVEQVRLHTKDHIVLDIVSKHHEYLDGSGSPFGLAGNSIPPYVRMVTLSDFLVDFFSTSILLPQKQPQHFIKILQAALTDKNIYQKYDIPILRAFLQEMKIYFADFSPLLAMI